MNDRATERTDTARSTAVVIVNFHQDRFLPGLFESLHRQSSEIPGVVLVNSALSSFAPPAGTRVIDLASNEGYGAALNAGIRWGLEGGADSFLLLNADTKLGHGCLAALAGTDADIVQPLIMLMDKPDRINVAGLKPTFLGVAYCMGYKKPREWAGVAAREIPAASGAAMFVRGHVFEKIGLFDTSYFMYLEDVDFSLRARNAGFKVVLNPAAVAWHEYRLKLGLRKIFWLLSGSAKIRRLMRGLISSDALLRG